MIRTTVLSVAVLSVISGLVSANPGCDSEEAVEAGIYASQSILREVGPVEHNAKHSKLILDAAKACNSDDINMTALEALAAGLSDSTDYDYRRCVPALGEAKCKEIENSRFDASEHMVGEIAKLCGKDDDDCAVQAIYKISRTLFGKSTRPTLKSIEAIVSVVKVAPEKKVKKTAVNILRDAIRYEADDQVGDAVAEAVAEINALQE